MNLYAKCGNNCGHCSLYKENLNDETRQWCAEGMRYLGWKPKPETLRQCAGCQAKDGYLYLKECAVRRCAQFNGVQNCAYCAVFPCRDVPTVSLSVEHRQQLAERLGAPIPEEDYMAFIEPYEGLKHLEVIRRTLQPQDFIQVKAVPALRVQKVDLPDDLPFSGTRAEGLRTLYRLLEDILTGRAELYVRQMLLRKRRSITLNLLWVFGRYGELQAGEEPYLLIDGNKHASLKPFTSIVRKRDNSLHGGAEICAGLLWDFGVEVQHVPLSRNSWLLKMSVEDSTGGVGLMKMLMHYSNSLVKSYGEPQYAGSARYKGEAYARFSRADMRHLGDH